eukprot:14156783-Ditylum_brightwellii.AAC.1
MKSSIDGLLDATLNGEKEIIGVEFKARTSSATAQAQQIRMDYLQQIGRHTTISSDATDIHKHFGKEEEAAQCLHH